MNKRFTSILRDKSGVALMTVVLIFLVLVLLLGATTFQAISNLNSSKIVGQHTSSFYAAESGINIVTAEFEAVMDRTALTDSQVYNELLRIRDTYMNYNFELSENSGNAVLVDVKLEDFTIDTYTKKLTTTIVSTGTIKNVSRTLYTTIEFNYRDAIGNGPESDLMQVSHAVFVKKTIKTGNGMITTVYPNDPTKHPKIATLSTQTNSINLNSGFQFPNGEIELTNPKSVCTNNVVVSSKFRCYVNQTILVEEDRPVNPPEVRVNFPTLDFTPIRERVLSTILSGNSLTSVTRIADMLSNKTFNNGNYLIDHLDFSSLSGNTTLTVDSGQDVFIITNKLTLGSVNITGDGTLTIYVNPGKNSFNPSSNGFTFGRTIDEGKLIIYVDTIEGVNNNSYHVTWPNNSKTRAYIMFENARIRFGQNSEYNGVLFTGAANGSVSAVTLSNRAHISQGEGRALIIATNGRVLMENNSSLSGAIIAVDFEQGNGGQSVVRYDPDFVQKIPLVISTPINGSPSEGQGRRLKTGATIER